MYKRQMYTTIEELNAHPEKYRDKWVFFQGYMENTSLRIIQNTHTPVSYTHLDVYKRQASGYEYRVFL